LSAYSNQRKVGPGRISNYITFEAIVVTGSRRIPLHAFQKEKNSLSEEFRGPYIFSFSA
jgi:hypothetical protein